jgi:cell division protein FtsX
MAEETKNEEAQEEAKAEKEKPVEEMTVKELREVAKGIPGIAGVSSMKKDQLLEAIKSVKEEGPKEEEAKKEQPREDEEVAEKEKKEPEEKEKPLDKMTAKELREMAKEIPGVAGVHAMKKEQLLEVIKRGSAGKGAEREGSRKGRHYKGIKAEDYSAQTGKRGGTCGKG